MNFLDHIINLLCIHIISYNIEPTILLIKVIIPSLKTEVNPHVTIVAIKKCIKTSLEYFIAT